MFFDRSASPSASSNPTRDKQSKRRRQLAAIGLAAAMAAPAGLAEFSRLYAGEAKPNPGEAGKQSNRDLLKLGRRLLAQRQYAQAQKTLLTVDPAQLSAADRDLLAVALVDARVHLAGQVPVQFAADDAAAPAADPAAAPAAPAATEPTAAPAAAPANEPTATPAPAADPAAATPATEPAAAAPAPATEPTAAAPAPATEPTAAAPAPAAEPAAAAPAATPATEPAVTAAPAPAAEPTVVAPTPAPSVPTAEAPAAPSAPRLTGLQYQRRAQQEYRKGDWISARRDFEAARAANYRPGLFEDTPAQYLAKMNKKENADRAETERRIAVARAQEEAHAPAQSVQVVQVTPAPSPAPAAETPAAPTATPPTEPAVVAPTPAPVVERPSTPVATTPPVVTPAPTPTRTEPVTPAVDAKAQALEDLHARARLTEVELQQNRYEASIRVQKAIVAKNDRDYARALELYSEAQSLDPDNAQARAGYSEIQIIQGQPVRVSPALDRQAKNNEAAAEEINYRFDSAIKEAQEATARGDFGAAENALQRAEVASATNRAIFPAERLRQFETVIAKTKSDLDQARERALNNAKAKSDTETARRIEIERRESEGQRRRTIQDLRATAMRLTENAQYRDALGVIDQILVLDPTNEYAIGVRPLLEDKFNLQQQRVFTERRDLEFTHQINAAEEKQIPYDDILRYPADWPDISQTRDQTVAAEHGDNKEDRAVQAQLDRPLPELTFDGVGFSDVIDFLRDVSGSNIFVNWKSLEGAGVDRNAQVTAKLRNIKFSKALSIILDSVGGGQTKLGYTIDEGVITIGTQEELGKNTLTRVYDIRDLIISIPDFTDAPNFDLNSSSNSSGQNGGQNGQNGGNNGGGGGGGGGLFGNSSSQGQQGKDQPGQSRQELVDAITKLITETVAPDSWRDAGGTVGALRELSGQLIVTQTPENHRALVNLLEQLRETRAIQVTVETRFLTVQRNFLEDVGVDLNFIFNINNKNSKNFSEIPITSGSAAFTANPQTAVPGSIGATSTPQALNTSITYLDDFQVSLLLRATEASVNSTFVTAPRVTLFNGQRAYVLVATQKAYVSNLSSTVGTGVSSFTPTVSIVQSGVLLDVTATVSADRKYVTLTLRPQLSELLDLATFTFQSASSGASNTAVGNGNTGTSAVNAPSGQIQEPEVRISEVKTTVSVPDGGTLLLGGQTIAGEIEKEMGVPVLSKIPFLKRLFTNRSTAKDEQILLILVKPTIVIEREIENRQFPLLSSKLGAS